MFASQEQSATAQEPAAQAPRLIVTTEGRIIEGEMTPNSLGYTVVVPGGQMIVPQNVIKLTAVNRHDAYRKYRDLMPEPTPDNHVFLARWCYQNQLAADARHELLQALKLDPNHQVAREMLVALERRIETPDFDAAPTVRSKFDALKTKMDHETSTAGLSPENVKEFITTIQPILMNNCAQAGCHHKAAKNDFRLEFVRLGGRSSRLSTENNLNAVLELLKDRPAGENPLLDKSRERHGGMVRTLALHPHGPQMLSKLEQWSNAVAPPAASPASRPGESSGVIQTVGATDELRSPVQNAAATETQPIVDEEQFVREVLRDSRPDRFDPARFNRNPR